MMPGSAPLSPKLTYREHDPEGVAFEYPVIGEAADAWQHPTIAPPRGVL